MEGATAIKRIRSGVQTPFSARVYGQCQMSHCSPDHPHPMTMGVEVLMGRKQSQAGTRGVKTAEGSVMGCGGHLDFVNWKIYMYIYNGGRKKHHMNETRKMTSVD